MITAKERKTFLGILKKRSTEARRKTHQQDPARTGKISRKQKLRTQGQKDQDKSRTDRIEANKKRESGQDR